VAVGLVASALTAPHIWPEDAVLLAAPLVIWAGRSLGGALAAAGALSLAYLGDTLFLGAAGHLEAVVVCGTLLGMVAQLGRRPQPRVAEAGPQPPDAQPPQPEPEVTLTGRPRPASG
jgi:hypothetical protein